MSYSLILKKADDSVHRVEILKEEIADALTQIMNSGSEILLMEKSAASHAASGMTNLQELHDHGLITLTRREYTEEKEMADWVLGGLISVLVCVLQLIGWKCLRELELIHQRVIWIQQDIQKMREGS